jgi:hypothetical protein
MGTSTPFGGGNNKNPLIPSWLGGGDGAGPPPGGAPPASANPAGVPGPAGSPSPGIPGAPGVPGQNQIPGFPPVVPHQNPATPPEYSPFDQRFRGSRTTLNRYARSGGGDARVFGHAVASYVSKGGGGSKTAARRMASDRRAASRLGAILTQAGQSGIRDVLRTLNLDALANQSIADIYASLVDVICGPGGDLDEAFPRDAYLEAVAEILDEAPADLEKPSPETISLIMERFIGNTIFDRILNAIGNGLITLPSSVSVVKAIDKSFREFIRGAVSDALNEIGRVLNSGQMKTVIDGIYERSLAILQTQAEAMANGESL